MLLTPCLKAVFGLARGMELGSIHPLDKIGNSIVGPSAGSGLTRLVICITGYAVPTRADVGPDCPPQRSNSFPPETPPNVRTCHWPTIGNCPLTLGPPKSTIPSSLSECTRSALTVGEEYCQRSRRRRWPGLLPAGPATGPGGNPVGPACDIMPPPAPIVGSAPS